MGLSLGTRTVARKADVTGKRTSPCKCLCKCAEEIRAILGGKRKDENDRKSLNQKDEMIVGRSCQNGPRRTRKPLNLHGSVGSNPTLTAIINQ
jgi:hypothetical protein